MRNVFVSELNAQVFVSELNAQHICLGKISFVKVSLPYILVEEIIT